MVRHRMPSAEVKLKERAMKSPRCRGLLLTALMMLAVPAFATALTEINPDTFDSALDIDSGIDLAPVANDALQVVETIYITAPDPGPELVLLTIEPAERMTAEAAEFVAITSSAIESVIATGGC
jgi:hypothetical protein